MVMAKNTKKMVVTKCPMYGNWFERSVKGAHKGIGDIIWLDKALSMDVLHEIM